MINALPPGAFAAAALLVLLALVTLAVKALIDRRHGSALAAPTRLGAP